MEKKKKLLYLIHLLNKILCTNNTSMNLSTYRIFQDPHAFTVSVSITNERVGVKAIKLLILDSNIIAVSYL